MAGIAGLAAGALAAGAIASALLVSGAGPIGNIIGAGHLRVAVNHGEGGDLDFSDLAPGETRTGDQLISGDMAGVATADLVLALSGVTRGAFADAAHVSISYSDPMPESAARVPGADGNRCGPESGLAHTAARILLANLSGTYSLGTLTATDTAVCVRYQVTLDPSADNSVQGASAGLSLDYSLTQTSASAS